MARLIVSAAASSDQTEILSDLHEKAGARTAARYRALFGELFDLLEIHPEIGARRPALGIGVRIGIVPPYSVPYRYDALTDTVAIVRLLHGRRHITRAMLGEAG